jgi:hypothetical protein
MRTAILFTLVAWLAAAAPAQAQAPDPRPTPTLVNASPDLSALKKRIAAQQKQLDDQRKKLDALVKAEAARDQKSKNVATQVKQIQEARDAEAMKKLGAATQKRFKPSFKLFGFADFNFVKRVADGHNKIGRLIMTEPASFYMLSANLYALSQITRNLKVLMELKFTYQPHGDNTENEAYFRSGDTLTLVEGTRFTRVNTQTYSPLDGTRSRMGGLGIERLHIDYRIADWLQFRVGRFLTPYGIWNIDHGSPVVIPASVPFLQRMQLMPTAQTGIQAGGRHFFTDRLRMDYAVTLTNGRGPMDEVADVDDMFAYGVRLRLVYEGEKIKFALGGYGYYGRLKDQKESVIIDVAANNVETGFTTTEHKDEWIVSADLLLQFFGVRLQAEYVYAYYKYHSPYYPTGSAASSAVTKVSDGVQPNYYSHGAYVLLAYTLPLKKWLGGMKLTPFASYEGNQGYDYRSAVTMMTAGLNFRPLPSLVFKAQWEGIRSDRLGNFNSAIVQMAVAF